MTDNRVTKKQRQNKTERPGKSLVPHSVSACKRCKLKKIKCDNTLPSCKGCERAKEPCISIDPATGEDVPRSYVLYLEDTVQLLLQRLKDENIDVSTLRSTIPTAGFDQPYQPTGNNGDSKSTYYLPNSEILGSFLIEKGRCMKSEDAFQMKPNELKKSFVLGGQYGNEEMVHGNQSSTTDEPTSDLNHISSLNTDATNAFLGDSSGVSFAKLVFTATNFEPDNLATGGGGVSKKSPSINDSIYKINDADFELTGLPSKLEAQGLVVRFFSYTNVQLPVLHREYFLKKYFEPVYGPWDYNVSLLSDYTDINASFELLEGSNNGQKQPSIISEPFISLKNKSLVGGQDIETTLPKEFEIPLFFLNIIFAIGYATNALEADLQKVAMFKKRASHFTHALFGTQDKMEALSGTLLLVIYAIMRPNVPGVWYILGSALRLTVDLGLHTESVNLTFDPFTREMRRRLFWSVYSLDRQVCSYFGRPFGIPEESITTRFPSLLDDARIHMVDPKNSNADLLDYSDNYDYSISSKVVAIAMFKIRKIQAAIVKVLYAPNSELPREYDNIENWRSKILQDLDNWYIEDVPKKPQSMNCSFNTFVFDLNYHYSKIVLYGLSPKCPTLTGTSFSIVFNSTKGTIDVFHNLCITKKLSYTWVAVHNIFMTGMTYLYVIYYSGDAIVKDEYDVLEYTTKVLHVLESLLGKCDSAKNCFHIYKTLTAVVKKLTFGSQHIKVKEEQIHNSENINPDIAGAGLLDISLDKFFQEMEKVGTSIPTTAHDESIPNIAENDSEMKVKSDSQDNYVNHSERRPSISQEGQMVDLLYQVSSQSIWDEFFVKSSHHDSSVSDMFL
ncbi:Ppr1 protein [Maudiozyma humilis]|uniref:Ppr1 protein n=1 Tax=Maudiozyma humilis TaxID=51915 RepID=A0AAV5RVP1_MAUHU|nr:Ppr1 protein [Kazachstania humilis]